MKITHVRYYPANADVFTDNNDAPTHISLNSDNYGDADDEADATAMATAILNERFPDCERNSEWKFLAGHIRECYRYPGDWRGTM